MLFNITYNFGNHRTVTKRLDFLEHAEYIRSLSHDELKTLELLYYHEPNKDELFALQNLKAIVLNASRRPCNEKVVAEKAFSLKNENNSSRPVQILFLDEMQMNARYSQEDSGGGECMCDWEYRTRCTCGFEEFVKTNPNISSNDEDEEQLCRNCGEWESDCECQNPECGGCGEKEELCDCAALFLSPKPYEVNTNLLCNADYFRKRARERVLSDLNNTFTDVIESGDNQITDVFYSWVIEVLREKGYDVQVLEEWQCSEELWSSAEELNKVPAIVFLTGRN